MGRDCDEARRSKAMRIALFTAILATLLAVSSGAWAIDKCGSGKRVTCVVDGDTIWLQGEKIRLKGFDPPDTTTNICGGEVKCGLATKQQTA